MKGISVSIAVEDKAADNRRKIKVQNMWYGCPESFLCVVCGGWGWGWV